MNIAVIGLGGIGRRHVGNFQSLGCGVKAWDANPDAWPESDCTAATLDAALDGADGVVIATPPDSHVYLANTALHVGAHVTGVDGDVVRLGRREAGAVRAVDQEAPDVLERHAADEVLDVDAAVAERGALLVRLGDLGLEGDDALQSVVHLRHVDSFVVSLVAGRDRLVAGSRPR